MKDIGKEVLKTITPLEEITDEEKLRRFNILHRQSTNYIKEYHKGKPVCLSDATATFETFLDTLLKSKNKNDKLWEIIFNSNYVDENGEYHL